jgi:DnaJ-class molecular chaperone
LTSALSKRATFAIPLFVFKYYNLLQLWHPENNPDDEQATEIFQKVFEAYFDWFQKRKLYDTGGKDFQVAHGFPGRGIMPFHHFGRGGRLHMSGEEAQLLFASFFENDDPFGGIRSYANVNR